MALAYVNEHVPHLQLEIPELNNHLIPEFLDGLPEKEKQLFGKSVIQIGATCLLTTALHPFTLVRSFWQFGFEPFPFKTQKMFWVVGQKRNYLPHLLAYSRHLLRYLSFGRFYTGVDSNIFYIVTSGLSRVSTFLYLERFYPDIGGDPVNVDKTETQLDDYQSLRVRVRRTIRETICTLTGIIISRPFAVVMARQIAQILNESKEVKYTNVLQSLSMIGREEGPGGLFSGLIPDMICACISVWGIASLSYISDRFTENYIKKSENLADEQVKHLQKTISSFGSTFLIPSLVKSFAYKYSVVSTVMATFGSGLYISMLPYSPTFTNWIDTFEYLKLTRGLDRGYSFYSRQYTGAVKVLEDGDMYATFSHFS